MADEAADMWGLGLIAFELLAGRPLFSERLADQVVLSMLLGCAHTRLHAGTMHEHVLEHAFNVSECIHGRIAPCAPGRCLVSRRRRPCPGCSQGCSARVLQCWQMCPFASAQPAADVSFVALP